MQNHIYDLCKQHMNQNVLLQTKSGDQIEGVIENLDDENVYVIVPTRSNDYNEESRQYNPYGGSSYPPRPHPRPPYGPGPGPGPRPPYGPGPRPPYGPGAPYPPGPGPRPRPPHGGYPPYNPGYPPYYGPGYGQQPGPGSGVNRLIIPLAALAAISVLPFI